MTHHGAYFYHQALCGTVLVGGWWCKPGWYGGKDICIPNGNSGLLIHGLPSFTRTGTATLRGDVNPPTLISCVPFSWYARLVLYLWFWNQILTWVGVNLIKLARCSLSGAERYFCCRNLRSNSKVWAFEKRTLRLRFLWERDVSPTDGESWSLSPSSSSWSSMSTRRSAPGGDVADAPAKDISDVAGDVLSGLACCPNRPVTMEMLR